MVCCIVHTAIALIGFTGKKRVRPITIEAFWVWEGQMPDALRGRLATAFVDVWMFASKSRSWDRGAAGASA